MTFTIRDLVLDVSTDWAVPALCELPTIQRSPCEFNSVEHADPKPCGDDHPTFIRPPECEAQSLEQCNTDISLQPTKAYLPAVLGELKVQLSSELEEVV
jgi:hypothetical protein